MINKKLINPIFMWLFVAVGAYFIFKIVSARAILTPNTFTYIIVVSAVFYWLYFFSMATFLNRKASQSTDKINKIIKEGIYGIVRHPIYAADIVLAWGIFLFWPDKRVLIAAAWLTLVLLFWMKLEEKALMEKFGDEYREYKKRVPMVFPRIFKSK